MKIALDLAASKDALKAAFAAAPKRETIPVLSHVRITASDAGIEIAATDLKVRVEARLTGEVREGGTAVIHAERLKSLLRGNWAELALADKVVTLETDALKARLSTLPAQDFPAGADHGEIEDLDISADDVADCLPFASGEEARHYLMGVCVDEGHTVATDGHRCIAIAGGGGARQIIPAPMIGLLAHLDAPKLGLGERAWRARAGEVTLVGQLIDGTYPDWPRVMPRVETTAEVDPDALKAAADAVAGISTDRSRATRLAIASGHGTVTVRHADTNEEATATFVAEGDLRLVGINGKYLASACAAFAGAPMRLGQGNEGDPILFEAGRRRVCVMPFRL